jgi:16S rRNA C1402 (ribose-2'-O) methylase RsmI
LALIPTISIILDLVATTIGEITTALIATAREYEIDAKCSAIVAETRGQPRF